MRKYIYKIGILSAALALVFVSSSTVLALPAQATANAQGNTNINAPTDSNAAASSQTTTTGQGATQATNAQTHLATAQLTACKNREAAITNIMTRIDTRAQNQITLFGTIATRVEAFYTKQGKTLSNYDQLVAAVNAAQAQANKDFGTLQSNNTFSCSASNPKGMVTAFQSYLKTEITDLQNYRTAVKNLIVGVASVNGVTVSSSSQSSTQGGN